MAGGLNPRQRHPNLAQGDAAQLHWVHQQLAVAERIHRQRLLRPRHRGQNQHTIPPRQRQVATAPPQDSLVPIWYFHQKPITLQLGAVLPIPPRDNSGKSRCRALKLCSCPEPSLGDSCKRVPFLHFIQYNPSVILIRTILSIFILPFFFLHSQQRIGGAE